MAIFAHHASVNQGGDQPNKLFKVTGDHPKVGIHHAAPDQNGDQGRNRVRDDQEGADEFLKGKKSIIEQYGNCQPQGEIQQQTEKGKAKVPGGYFQQRSSQGRTDEEIPEVVEFDRCDETWLEGNTIRRRKCAPQVLVNDTGLLVDHDIFAGII